MRLWSGMERWSKFSHTHVILTAVLRRCCRALKIGNRISTVHNERIYGENYSHFPIIITIKWCSKNQNRSFCCFREITIWPTFRSSFCCSAWNMWHAGANKYIQVNALRQQRRTKLDVSRSTEISSSPNGFDFYRNSNEEACNFLINCLIKKLLTGGRILTRNGHNENPTSVVVVTCSSHPAHRERFHDEGISQKVYIEWELMSWWT